MHKTHWFVAAACSACLALAAPFAMAQCPDPRFTQGQFVVPWGSPPIDVLDTRDIDGDGLADILAARLGQESPSGTILVLLSNGDGSFTQTYFEEGTTQRLSCLGDLNGDNLPDLVVSRRNPWPTPQNIEVRFNDGTGHFGSPTVYQPLATWHEILDSLSCVDLNGDALPDLVYLVDGYLRTRLNLGAGILGEQRLSAVTGGYQVPLLVDVTGDGIPEAVQNGEGGLRYYSDESGTGGYDTPHQVSWVGSYDFAVIDIDGDGDLDLTVAEYRGLDGGSYHTYLNDGAGNFTDAPVLTASVAEFSNFRTYADIDGDGDLDMIVPDISENAFIIRYRNTGSGAFNRLADLPAQASLWVRAADLNGDSIVDFAWPVGSGPGGGGLAVMLGRGDGEFDPVQHHLTQIQDAYFFHQLYLVDVTGDHLLDAVMTTSFGFGGGDGSGALFAMTAFCSCPADFDGNGMRDVGDLFAFLSVWFAGDPTADVDGIGGVQVEDIFEFLNAWFAGCL